MAFEEESKVAYLAIVFQEATTSIEEVDESS
jgi:hypothetical protein